MLTPRGGEIKEHLLLVLSWDVSKYSYTLEAGGEFDQSVSDKIAFKPLEYSPSARNGCKIHFSNPLMVME